MRRKHDKSALPIPVETVNADSPVVALMSVRRRTDDPEYVSPVELRRRLEEHADAYHPDALRAVLFLLPGDGE